jgi:uncharacterized protein (DUF2236 family)
MCVLFSLVDSALVVYQKYVRTLSEAEQAALWDDYRVGGRLFGLRRRDMPDTLAALGRYRRAMLEGERLYVSDWARERARDRPQASSPVAGPAPGRNGQLHHDRAAARPVARALPILRAAAGGGAEGARRRRRRVREARRHRVAPSPAAARAGGPAA